MDYERTPKIYATTTIASYIRTVIVHSERSVSKHANQQDSLTI